MLQNKDRGVSDRRSVFSRKDFYFIFGQIDTTVDGVPMKDRWVRVRARNMEDATKIFITEFASKFMPSVNHWSRAIPENVISNWDFQKEVIFTEGEYRFFLQKDAL